MKKLIFALTAAVLMLGSCGNKNNMLFDRMQADDLYLYRYDGGEVEVYRIVTTGTHRSVKEERMVQTLRRIHAEPASAASAEFPIYAVSSGSSEEGEWFRAAWSDGYLYTADGAVYEFDYNFEKAIRTYDFVKQRGDPLPETLPCVYYIVRGDDGWDTDLLREVSKSSPAEGMGVSVAERTEEQIVLKLVNHGTEPWEYFGRYTLHGNVDGIWYHLPAMPEQTEGEIAVLEIPVGSSAEIPCDLSGYGDLPEGDYRLVLEGTNDGGGREIYFEFKVSKGK